MTTALTDGLRIEYVPIESLRPDPANPRRISEAELEALTRSLHEFGFVQPVLARRDDRTVIGGHQRVIAARRLGWNTVPVVLLDISVDQGRLLNIALNKISGNFDDELLGRLLADLATLPDIDVTLSGFGEDEIAQLVKSLDARDRRERVETFDLDQALEDADKAPARTKPGEVWLCGDHRIGAGDATKADDVARLLGGRRADMAVTDPPYGVGLGDHGGQQRGARRRRIVNDSMPPAEWEAFCRGWAAQLVGNVDGAIFCFMSTKEWPLVSRVLEEAGAHWSDTIIWGKDRFTLGRADYQRQYEPIWFGWREGAKHHWCGDRDQGDLWMIPRPSESPLNPAQKPLALLERAITNSSLPGDSVLDLFSGSGSVLISCERTGRICLGLELDPRNVDIAVMRWESFSGLTAVKEEG